jgi:hypothetical protein
MIGRLRFWRYEVGASVTNDTFCVDFVSMVRTCAMKRVFF